MDTNVGILEALKFVLNLYQSGFPLGSQRGILWSTGGHLGTDTNWTLFPEPTGHDQECKHIYKLNCMCSITM